MLTFINWVNDGVEINFVIMMIRIEDVIDSDNELW